MKENLNPQIDNSVTTNNESSKNVLSRRSFLKGVAGIAGAAALAKVESKVAWALPREQEAPSQGWGTLPIVDGEVLPSGEVVLPEEGLIRLTQDVNRRTEPSTRGGKETAESTSSGSIFEKVKGEEDLADLDGSTTYRWTGANLIYTDGQLVEKEHAYLANNQGFFEEVTDLSTLPEEVQALYRTSSEEGLPMSITSYSVDELTAIYSKQIGGLTETEQEMFAAWKMPKEVTAFEQSALGAWQRSVAMTAFFQPDMTTEAMPSGGINVCEYVPGTVGTCNYYRHVDQENGFVDVISRFTNPDDSKYPDLFVTTRFVTDEEGTKKVSGVGFTTPEGLMTAYGKEAEEIAKGVTPLQGSNIAELAHSIDSLTTSRVFLPGMPKESQFVNKVQAQEGENVAYKRKDRARYQAIGSNGQGETRSLMCTADTGRWVEIPAFTQEVAQAAGTNRTSEADVDIDVTQYGQGAKGFTVWVRDASGERSYKANQFKGKEWIWNEPGLGDYFQEEGMDFGIAIHNRNNNLGRKEDVGVIVKDASIIATEEAGEWRYLNSPPVRYDEAKGKWEYIQGDPALSMNWSKLDEIVNFAKQTGKEVFFHHLIDHVVMRQHMRMPKWFMDHVDKDLQALNADPSNTDLKSQIRDKYLSFLTDHVRAVMSRYKGTIKHYGLANEFLPGYDSPNDWEDTFREPNMWEQLINGDGVDYITECSKVAREVDPDAELALTDQRSDMPQYVAAMIQRANGVRNAGGYVDTLGMQFHTSIRDTRITPAYLDGVFSQIADAGYNVRLTELDWMHVEDASGEQYKAQMAGWIVDAAQKINARYGRPVVKGIHMWGYRDDDTSMHIVMPDQSGIAPLLYKKTAQGLEPGPIYHSFMQAITS